VEEVGEDPEYGFAGVGVDAEIQVVS